MMDFCRSQKGFTLIELLAAMTVLVAVFAATVPLYLTVSRVMVDNRAKLIAATIANRELERVRNLSYDDVGLVGGNPGGVLQAEKDETHPSGFTFHISTRVWWIDDSYDGTAAEGNDSSPNDYKEVQISVTRQGEEKVLARVSTKVARESEEPPPTGGNILVRVWLSDGKTPVEDAKVDVTEGPSAPITAYTGADGTVLLAGLTPSQENGDYAVEVSKPGYIVPPDQIPLTTTVIEGQTRVLEFLMDVPGHLIVRLKDPNGNLIDKRSTITLNNPYIDEVTYNSSNGYFDIPELYPGDYDITADAASYEPTPEPVTVTVVSNQTTEVDITLQPVSHGQLHLEVFDASTEERIGPATVTITNNDTGDTITTETNDNGVLEIQLEVGTYTVEVTMPDYLPYTNSSVEIQDSGNTMLNVYLQPSPQYGSILVRTLNRYTGRPRPYVWIRVIGSGYDEIQQTDENGETVFENLNPGIYRVYRWRGWRWGYRRWVRVEAGQQAVVIYRF